MHDGKDSELIDDPRRDNLEAWIAAMDRTKPKPQLVTHQVMIDPDRAVASFAGSTDSNFYPLHISISQTRPSRLILLQILRKSLVFTWKDLSIGGHTIQSWGKCRPVPLDPANKI